MPIDFHDTSNAKTYASRGAHQDWFVIVKSILDGRNPGIVTDIGCGGGIYSRAWRDLGADRVIGIDSSAQMIDDARYGTDDPQVQFLVADAYETELDANTCDIVFSRAVIHHLDDHTAAMVEAFRVLKPGGLLIVQDRSIEDVLQPATPQHFRAYFFETHPQLIEFERQRRPVSEVFQATLVDAGFRDVAAESFWETRRMYQDAEELRNDLLARTGRSILHEIRDHELVTLTDSILAASKGHFPLKEQDRWTMWTATKPIDS